ncbi:phosphate/phosphite/phosphonate ABC transporter substrate-binding protein [Actinoplanes flavus]|uniref:PhnD/SsuA/transferrin family substrate-binding protein n=1 Tax=Actinoplanes flavus TaxID=2820290 RepID=A0ABS3USC2_9ACTN|nr:PhnD/SsuA/transferrin family substrate-binding protein [Actinoplanes flavus]MBO3741478.1 PhnD/SsuA/transferrin family substrate-binding protein [Actinoplanes flavus]
MTTFTMGAVAYDPKVVTIWDGFRAWLTAAGLPFDYVLYSHYERQVEDLVAGRIDAAWNSPLAWIRARRLAEARDLPIRALVMRDTDRDLATAVVVRADSGITAVGDLRGRTVATGAVDSPQATLLPLEHLRGCGLQPGTDFTVHRFDVGVGLHGDHVGGERDAARALIAGDVDAACVLDGNHLLFTKEGVLPSGSTRLLTTTARYDHCNMTVTGAADPALVARFEELLRSMSYADPAVRGLLDLEGLTSWEEGRTDGYDLLEAAVTASGFYDATGAVTAAGYRP